MAKKLNTESLINVEIQNLEDKVKEFQTYLKQNSINTNTNGIRYDDTEDLESQDKRHKEIVIQIKMQDALFNWLPLLEKLRQGEDAKKLETRGDVPVNGLYASKQNK